MILGKYTYSDEELLQLYIKKTRELGRPPTRKELDTDYRYPDYKTYKDRFGGLNKVKRILGYIKSKKTIHDFCKQCSDVKNCSVDYDLDKCPYKEWLNGRQCMEGIWKIYSKSV